MALDTAPVDATEAATDGSHRAALLALAIGGFGIGLTDSSSPGCCPRWPRRTASTRLRPAG